MNVGLTVEGLKELQRNFKKADHQMQDALSAAVYQEALALCGEAKKRTPVDTGRLRSTGYAAPPEVGRKGPEAEVGFGTNYGLAVHESLSAFHQVGGPKYLESAMNDRRSGYTKRMADRTWQNYQRGVGVTAIPSSEPTRPSK